MDVQELLHQKEIAILTDYLEEVMGITPQSKPVIIPDWPFGWHAYVAGDDFVLTIGYNKGYLRLIDVTPCRGFYSTGAIRMGETGKEIDELMDFYADEQYPLKYYRSPLNCMGSACNSSSANCVMCNNH